MLLNQWEDRKFTWNIIIQNVTHPETMQYITYWIFSRNNSFSDILITVIFKMWDMCMFESWW
jgi:hypothetical protein